jgi:hypothetical protein
MSASGSIRGIGKGKDVPEFLRQIMEESLVRACDRRNTDLPGYGHDSLALDTAGLKRRGGEREIAERRFCHAR